MQPVSTEPVSTEPVNVEAASVAMQPRSVEPVPVVAVVAVRRAVTVIPERIETVVTDSCFDGQRTQLVSHRRHRFSLVLPTVRRPFTMPVRDVCSHTTTLPNSGDTYEQPHKNSARNRGCNAPV